MYWGRGCGLVGHAYVQLAQLGNMQGQKLHGDNGQDALQAVYTGRH